MKSEVKIRQKRVLVWILITALLWNHATPTVVRAADSSTSETLSISSIEVGTLLQPGDSLDSSDGYYGMQYLDTDGTFLSSNSSSTEIPYSVLEYSVDSLFGSDTGTDVALILGDTDIFYGWLVTERVLTSAEELESLQLKAVQGQKINYELDGGTNAASNPSTYGVGIGVASFAEPSKTGHTFAGWYIDADCTKAVDNISEDETEEITLYAKWELAIYTITYIDSDGVTVLDISGDTTPSTYTYGEGVSSFGMVEKEGYTFVGWYDAVVDGTKIESISDTQTEDITLYARYTANSYDIIYELDGGINGEGNPEQYTYGVGVEKFADASKTGYTFGGWYLDEALALPVTSIGIAEMGEMTLYAKFIVNSYGIIYELNGGENGEGNPEQYTYGVGVEKFADASKEGHTFKGWYDAASDGTKVESINVTQTGDVTLYAQFDVNTYNITYVLDGGTNASENPNGYTYGVGVEKFADASKPGYTFEGWYSDTAFENRVTSIGEAETDAVTLYAKFTANKYKINYELNGGTNSESNPTEYTYGVGVLDFAMASKEGYTFEGWYSDAAFTTKVESIDSTMREDVTLYAKFTANIYTITYVLIGGTNDVNNPAEYTYGVGVEKFADASRNGYTFGGWYLDEAYTNQITAISTTDTGAVTLYAKWTPNTYEIIYVLNGGTNGDNNPSSYTFGVGVTNFSAATKEGYSFKGWYNAAEGGTQITSISDTQTGDIILYAQYTANTYTITYELAGGVNESSNPGEYTYGVGVSSLADASKTGYTFDGWYRDAAYTNQITSIGTTEMGEVTLYAKFTVNKYAITYELNGGRNASDNPNTFIFGEGVEKLADASKTGHNFMGWYTDADYSIKIESISASQASDVTVYAKWEAASYNISYKNADGTEIEVNEATNPSKYTYGVGVESLADASKEGHTFTGWYDAATDGTKITNISNIQVGDITLYAQYTVNTYAINYELDGGTNASENPNGYIYGIGIESFGDATKPGYTFDSWYTDANFSLKVVSINANQTGNITLYAKWTEIANEPEEDVPEADVPEEDVPEADVPIVEIVEITSAGTVSLKAGTAYVLGSGTWKIAGDDTIYMGDMTFYVVEDMECEFIKQ